MKPEIINFTNLNQVECEMVLRWRNHPDIRKYMTNRDIISEEEHLRFIKALENTTTKKYFLVRQEDEYLGVIDFVDIRDSSCEFGLYVNPYLQKKGVGGLLLEEIIRYAFEELRVRRLKAKLFKENKKALRLYKRYKLKILYEDEEYFYMELENG